MTNAVVEAIRVVQLTPVPPACTALPTDPVTPVPTIVHTPTPSPSTQHQLSVTSVIPLSTYVSYKNQQPHYNTFLCSVLPSS